MRDFIIATASTCDLDKKWLDEHDVPMIPYTFEVEGTVYTDDCRPETKRTIFRLMREGKLPNTSQITTYSYYEFFRHLISEGKPVIFADMDKAISSSHFNYERAADQIREEYPNAELHILDTRCITIGLGILLKNMVRLADEGKSCSEVLAWAEENKMRISHRFLIEDLQWLSRGGRLSNASALVGTLLAIKPLIYVNDEGKLVSFDKVRGRKKAMRTLLDSTAADLKNPAGKNIVVCHSDCAEDGEKLKNMVMERYPEAASVTVQELGPVIGCHVGPDFLAIAYISDSDTRTA